MCWPKHNIRTTTSLRCPVTLFICKFNFISKCTRYLLHDVVWLWTILYHNREMGQLYYRINNIVLQYILSMVKSKLTPCSIKWPCSKFNEKLYIHWYLFRSSDFCKHSDIYENWPISQSDNLRIYLKSDDQKSNNECTTLD